MKYAIVIPDGAADEPLPELGGRTPLAAADLPAMNAIAREGVVGRSNNVPARFTPGSEVANMSLLGYDPEVYFTGRAPIEAAAQGIQLAANDWAIRCNLVTIEEQVLRDFTADHISTAEATELLAAAQQQVAGGPWEFVPGVSYRNLLLYRGGDCRPPFTSDTRSTAPHDLIDHSIVDDFPRGPGSRLLTDLMSRSVAWFAEHPVNQRRRQAGKRPATNVWLWGLGQTPALPPFREVYGVTGRMITAVDLLRGLARLVGWETIEVPGATGYLDTDYAAKGRYAVAALDEADLVCVHVEASDEASHEGNLAEKMRALEQIDRQIVAPLWQALQARGEYRILVMPDHPTPLRTKRHSHGDVPFALAGTRITPRGAAGYHEAAAAASELAFPAGWQLMKFFLQGEY